MLEQDFCESGHRFAAAGLADRALEAFWKGKLYAEIVQLVEKNQNLVNAAEARVSSFLCDGKSSALGAIQLLTNLVDRIANVSGFKGGLLTPWWKESVSRVVASGVPKDTAGTVESTWKHFADLIDSFVRIGLILEPEVVAKVFVLAGRFEDAMGLLDKERGSDLFKEARARSLISKHDVATGTVSSEESRAAADFLLKSGRVVDASKWFGSIDDVERIEECLRDCFGNQKLGEKDVAIVMAHLLSAAVRKGHFSYLVAVYKDASIDRVNKEGRARIFEAVFNHNVLYTSMVLELSKSESVTRERSNVQINVAEMLREILIGESKEAKVWQKWRSVTSVQVAGGAIERAGRDIDGLLFYEKVLDDRASNVEEKDFAKKRWVRCKLRQSQRDDRQTEREPDETKKALIRSKAIDHREEARKKLDANGWSVDDLGEEYPSDRAPKVVPSSHFLGGGPQTKEQADTWKMGRLSFTYFASTKRVNIDDTGAGDRARVDLVALSVVSEDVTVTEIGQGLFRLEAWSLDVQFEKGKKISFKVGELFQELHLSS